MQIYELARDMGVDREALLFLAQKQGIEARSIASKLTTDEKEKLLVAFDEAGGVLETVETVAQSNNRQKVTEEKPAKQSFLKAAFSHLRKYEKQPEEPKIPEAKTIKEGRALRIYRLVALFTIALFVGLGYSAYNANIQMTELTKKVNETTQILNDNQKEVADQNKKILERVKILEEGQKKLESTPKSTDKKPSAPKPKAQPSQNKK